MCAPISVFLAIAFRQVMSCHVSPDLHNRAAAALVSPLQLNILGPVFISTGPYTQLCHLGVLQHIRWQLGPCFQAVTVLPDHCLTVGPHVVLHHPQLDVLSQVAAHHLPPADYDLERRRLQGRISAIRDKITHTRFLSPNTHPSPDNSWWHFLHWHTCLQNTNTVIFWIWIHKVKAILAPRSRLVIKTWNTLTLIVSSSSDYACRHMFHHRNQSLPSVVV